MPAASGPRSDKLAAMNRDDNNHDADEGWISKRASGPSRSQRRREALDVLALAGALMDVPDGAVARLPLDESLRELVLDSRRITAQIARKRQMQYLAKHLRREDEAVLEALRAALDQDRGQQHREAARLHRLEALRGKLIAEGDAALPEALALFPRIDRNKLRQLVRQARADRDRDNASPRAFRELFRLLREADSPGGTRLDGDDPGLGNVDPEAAAAGEDDHAGDHAIGGNGRS